MSDGLPLPALPADLHGPVLVGFSGGLDSTVLLHTLAAMPAMRVRGLRALHVHHGLQAGADNWAAHCVARARQLDVPLEVVTVRVDCDAGEGLEAAARHARYAALARAMGGDGILATAHHLDDQAETFLLRALRASGPEGLGAMRPLRRFAGGWHWRPLLATARQALLDHARALGLEWIEDPSNAVADPERNFLRLQLMPLLRQRWPHAAAALARSAALSAEADALLEHEDAALLQAHTGDPGHSLALAPLRALAQPRRARVLRLWIRRLGLPRLPAQGVQQVEHALLEARADADAQFAWAGAWIRRWRDRLHAGRILTPLPRGWQATWDGRAPLVLPDGGQLWLQGDPAAAAAGWDRPLQARARQGGERIVLPGRTHSHALKHVLQDQAMPPWQRAHLPLLYDAAAGTVVAAGTIAAAPLQAWLQARGLHLAWQPPGAPA